MVAVVSIFDERPGVGRRLSLHLDVPERITARELIRRRVVTELADVEAGPVRCDQWLVVPGDFEWTLNGDRPAFGPRPYSLRRCIDADLCVRQALDAFAHNAFFMIFDGRQITDLDQPLVVERESAVTFIRLVPLAGG